MSDAIQMISRLITAVQHGGEDDITEAINAIWHDGFRHGEESVRWDLAEQDEMPPAKGEQPPPPTPPGS